MSKECRRDDSFVTAIAHCHGDAGEANGDGENGSFHVPLDSASFIIVSPSMLSLPCPPANDYVRISTVLPYNCFGCH